MTQAQIAARNTSRPSSHPYAKALEGKPASFYDYESYTAEWGDPSPYEVTVKCGRGRYSEVWFGRNLLNNHKCCIKVLKPVKEKRLSREILILQNICGVPNVITLYDLVHDPETNTYAFVFEKIDTVSHRKFFPTLTEADCKYYMFELLRALNQVHAMGIMHRDIKPQNMAIDPVRKIIRIIDWGLAEFYHEGVPYNLRVASRHYKGPELLVGERRYDYALDLWSLGCTFAAMLFHIDPFFTGEELDDVLVNIVNVLGTDVMDAYCREHELERPKCVREFVPRRPWTSFVNESTPLATPEALQLLDGLLTFDHEARVTAAGAMQLPYFASIRAHLGADGAPSVPPTFSPAAAAATAAVEK